MEQNGKMSDEDARDEDESPAKQLRTMRGICKNKLIVDNMESNTAGGSTADDGQTSETTARPRHDSLRRNRPRMSLFHAGAICQEPNRLIIYSIRTVQANASKRYCACVQSLTALGSYLRHLQIA